MKLLERGQGLAMNIRPLIVGGALLFATIRGDEKTKKNGWQFFNKDKPYETENVETRKFHQWFSKKGHGQHVLLFRVDDEDRIAEIDWNTCAVADEEIIRRLAKTRSVQGIEVWSTTKVLPLLVLEKIKKDLPDWAASEEVEVSGLVIIQMKRLLRK